MSNREFYMNGYRWRVEYVNSRSPFLVDRTNKQRVATTDPNVFTIYISDELSGDFLLTVLIHELGHCALFSFNLLPQIHNIVDKRHWVEAEEWVCNFIADYGLRIFTIARSVLGDDSIPFVANAIEGLMT